MKLYHELAEHYFAIEKNHRDIRNDVSFIITLLRGKKEPALLDLGCGSGEHLGLIARQGVRCTGIDISADMLAQARERFPEGIEFIRSSMTDIEYDNAFDMVMSLFGSFNYLIHDAEIDSMLRKIRRALKPGGLAILEIWNAPPIMKIREKEIGPVSTTLHDDTSIRRERGFKLREDTGKTVVEVNYRYTVDGPGGMKSIRDRHVMRCFTPGEIKIGRAHV